MDKSDRSARRARAIELRDIAVGVVRRLGRAEGNVDYHGQFTRIASFERGRLHIEYWSPRHPTGEDRGEAKPTTYQIFVRFAGERVFQVGWDGDRINVVRCEDGNWEAFLRAL